MSFKSVLLAATAVLATTNAHVLMKSPVPFAVDKLDNGPISKSQYPCKSQLGFSVSKTNSMAVGEKQTLELSGSAVHGGGSCQLSVTLDTEPTANSVFKVIKSMEGGCPGVDSQANSYDFELPASIPNGKATFAWTWMSKLSGQPELYMNCAPIEVTGGASDSSAFDALPDMLVINLDDECESVPNFSVAFPNPGDVVEKGSTNDSKPPTGSCASKGSGPSEPNQPAQPSPSAGQPSAAPSSTAGEQSSATAAPSSAGGVFAPGASSAVSAAPPAEPTGGPAEPPSAPQPTQSTSTTLVTVTAAPTAPKPANPTAPPSASAPPTSGGNTCSPNGAVVCNGEKQFGLCNNGQVVWQDVAAGTACVNGVISKRSAYNGRIVRRSL